MLIKLIERSLVYPRPSRERGDWRPKWLMPQNVWFRSGDNTKLHGWYVPNADAKRLILYAHGNGEHVADQASLVFRLQSHLQATVFVYDYRGYGRSRGKPTERGCVADGLAAQRWLAEREGVNCEDIVLMGRSIGGAVSVAGAAEQGCRALVVEATFSRMTDAAAHRYPYLPVRVFMSNRYNSLKRMKKYSGPLFQSHGTDDEVVPIKLARKLFDSSPTEHKQFYEINFARHNDTPPPAYYQALGQFLDRVDREHEETLPASVRRRNRRLVSKRA
jgi:fermentation-respiration switch protein FrsA (DUF1100 family)